MRPRLLNRSIFRNIHECFHAECERRVGAHLCFGHHHSLNLQMKKIDGQQVMNATMLLQSKVCVMTHESKLIITYHKWNAGTTSGRAKFLHIQF